MVGDVLYGDVVLKPYFNLERFEDRIYRKTRAREKRINSRKRLVVVDKLLAVLVTLVVMAIGVLFAGILYRSVMINNKEYNISRLEKTLDRKKFESNNIVTSLKTEMKFDDIKMKAYTELNMIVPTERNVIHFNKSENEFVRQYENIR